MEEYIDLCEKVIEKTIPKVDYVDIRAGKSNVDEVNTGNTLGFRIRVLNNGAWGFAYTNDYTKLEEIAETSITLANSLKGDIELAQSEIIKDKVVSDVKIPFSDVI